MAGQILRVLRDDDLRERLRGASKALSREFDGRKTIKAMQELYEKIMVEEIAK